MPTFRSNDKASGMPRGVKALLDPRGATGRGAAPDAARREERQAEEPDKDARPRTFQQREGIKNKRRELRRRRQESREIRDKQRAAKERTEIIELKRRRKRAEQEIFQLERELRAAEEGWAPGEPVTGALPDFLVIGVGKGGTTFLYHLLTQHPLVEPAATKELHYFDALYEEEGVEWYRRCFPAPRLKDGRWTITGEASPYMAYMAHRLVPERMAKVIPRARLIALLRNPVDRAYSHYHKVIRSGRETRTFEEAIEAEKAWLLGDARREYCADDDDLPFGYLYKGMYVDHLLRWYEFFPEEQLLVLKSEDLFEHPEDTLKVALDFLGLPEWEPEASVLQKKRNTRKYEKMDPATRGRLEEYFEPHNRRLYDLLGRDFGW